MTELLWYDAHGPGGSLWVLNALVLALDLALPVSVMAMLATYPNGVATSAAVRLMIGAGWGLVIAVPAASLLSGARQVPAYVLVWNEGLSAVPGPSAATAVGAIRAAAVGLHQSALALVVLAGALALVLRYRGADVDDRLRIRWLALAGVLVAIDGVFSGVPSMNVIPEFVSITLIGVFPALAAVGMVRPELLDVDEALRRSALFAALWVLLSLAYVAVAGLVGAAAASSNGGAVAVPVTVAAMIAFQPVWQRGLGWAGRHLFGRRLDGDELLRRVGQALEHTLDPTALAGSLAGTIRDGLGVEWVRVALDGQPVATAGTTGAEAHVAIATEVTHDGEVLGRIDCGPRTRGSLRSEDRERLLLLGRQAGLAAHNARLAGELAQQATELAASRARIIEAEEAGRRRIQRDIHDGIQQDLVALIAHLGLAEAQCGRVPDVVPEALRELRTEAVRALTELRDLASGIHPSVLGDRGIVEAIEARAARLPIGVTILAENLRGRRFPAVVESAVYFVVCEALVNAVKHSRADDVVVRLHCRGQVLELEVCDDGVGFAAGEVTGTGLAGLSDRLEALNGSLVVESSPGGGTRLRGQLLTSGESLHV
jgi:signal transduction histidine kinase